MPLRKVDMENQFAGCISLNTIQPLSVHSLAGNPTRKSLDLEIRAFVLFLMKILLYLSFRCPRVCLLF